MYMEVHTSSHGISSTLVSTWTISTSQQQKDFPPQRPESRCHFRAQRAAAGKAELYIRAHWCCRISVNSLVALMCHLLLWLWSGKDLIIKASVSQQVWKSCVFEICPHNQNRKHHFQWKIRKASGISKLCRLSLLTCLLCYQHIHSNVGLSKGCGTVACANQIVAESKKSICLWWDLTCFVCKLLEIISTLWYLLFVSSPALFRFISCSTIQHCQTFSHILDASCNMGQKSSATDCMTI